MWWLSTDGQQSGPFSSEQITSFITNQQLSMGFVCAVDEQQWIPLERHPAFGPVLAAAVQASAPASPTPVAPRRAASRTTGRTDAGPWLMACLGLTVVAALVVTIVRLASGSTGALAQWVPKDVTTYLEVSNVPEALESVARMRVVDGERLDTEQVVDSLADAIERALRVDEDVVHELLDDLESVAIAGRSHDEHDEGVLLLRLSSADAMEELLTSHAFDRQHPLGGVGQRYRVRPTDPELEALALRYGVGTEGRAGGNERAIGWFPEQRLLVVGHLRLIDDMVDVIEDGEGSLADAETWKAANIDEGADAISYVDSLVMHEQPLFHELARRYFDGAGAITWSARVEEHGTVTTMEGRLRGSGVTRDGLPEPTELDHHRRLPAATVAYATLAIPKSMVAVGDLHDVALGLAGLQGQQRMLEDLVRQAVSTLWNATGDQLTVAVVASRDLELGERQGFAAVLDDMAVGVVLELSDRGVLDEQLRTLRMVGFDPQELASVIAPGAYDASPSDDGVTFVAKQGGVPSVRVELLDDALVIAAGGRAMIDEFVAAARGDGALLDDSAHAQALTAVASDAYAHAWVDVARLARALPPEERERVLSLGSFATTLGLAPRLWVLEGEHRLTFAAGLHMEAADDTWRYELRMLNGDAMLGSIATSVVESVAARFAHAWQQRRTQASAPGWPTGAGWPAAPVPPGTPRGTPLFW